MNLPASGDLSEELERSLLEAWDAVVVDYDHERFPVDAWILDEVRRLGHDVSALDRIHAEVPLDEVYPLTKALCDATRGDEFQRRIREFVEAEIVPKGALVAPIAIQRALNVRIMLPDAPHAVFPFHTGLLYGHGHASRSLWVPLTDVSREEDASASLQMIDIKASRALVARATRDELSIAEMNELFGSRCRAIRARPGQVVLFSQENIHGNFVNRTGRTRVSIDFRLAEARFGDLLARKTMGGYFDVLENDRRAPSHAAGLERLRASTQNVAYLNNNSHAMSGTPPHLQRYMLEAYAAEHGFRCAFELFELETMDHLPTLHHVVGELRCNAVLYSVFSLPEDAERRRQVYEAAQESGVVLAFVNEDLLLAEPSDRARIEELFDFVEAPAQRGPLNGGGPVRRA